MISRRREERTNVSAPIRMWGMDANGKPFSVPATTYDLTRYGARVMGVRIPLAPGEIVGVQHGAEKARFRVAWYGRPGSRLEGNVGLQALDWKKHIWGNLVQDSVPSFVDINSQPLGNEVPAYAAGTDPLLERMGADTGAPQRPAIPAPPSKGAIARLVAAERRLATRYDCDAAVEITDALTGQMYHGKLREMSLVGCFIYTEAVLAQRTPVSMVIRPLGLEISCAAQVRHIEPELGFGVKFGQMSEAAREVLEQTIEQLASSSAATSPRAMTQQSRSQQMASAVEKLSSQLREVESLVAKHGGGVDPQLTRTLRSQTEQARQTASLLRQWLEMQDNRQDPSPLRIEIENRRLKASTALLRELLTETESSNFVVEHPAVAELYAAAVAVYRRLAWLAERRNPVP